jgi:hypothetical protein
MIIKYDLSQTGRHAHTKYTTCTDAVTTAATWMSAPLFLYDWEVVAGTVITFPSRSETSVRLGNVWNMFTYLIIACVAEIFYSRS